MFGRLRQIENDISNLNYDMERVKERPEYDLVMCVKCGCAVKKTMATRGLGVIKEKSVVKGSYIIYTEKVEYIHYDYFCKLHKPKEKK